MLNVVVFVSGGGTNLQAIIDAVENGQISNTKIKAVISNKKDAYALKRAQNHGIEGVYLSPKDFSDKEQYTEQLLEMVGSYETDLIILAGYLVILPELLIQKYRNKIINIHPSLIPSFCGMGFYGIRVHEAVLERGCKITGATVHFVDEEADTGPIIMQKAVEVAEHETAESLQQKVMEEAEWVILPQTIHLIAKGKITVKNGKVMVEDGGNR